MKKLRGMVLGAYIGDTLALGPHWIYDQEKIRAQWENEETLTGPMIPYHKGKCKGDFTHYGDQALFLQRYLNEKFIIEKEEFYKAYNTYMMTYQGYKDSATSKTLDYIKSENNKALKSHSNELGGITSVYNLIWHFYPSLDKTLEQVALRTQLTHDDENLIIRSAFIVRWTYGVLQGGVPSKVLYDLEKESPKLIRNDIEKAESVLIYSSEVAIKMLGQSCDSNDAFPSVIFLMLKYEDSIKEALIKNVYGGGDSAARGMILGGLLGAYHGETSLPVHWLMGMTNLKEIENLISGY